MENKNGKVIEIPQSEQSPKKALVEAKQYLLTEQERLNIIAICDIAVKTTGLRGVAEILAIAKIFSE